jgi:hypothetical protein
MSFPGISKTFAVAVAMSIALTIMPSSQAADKACSDATLKGAYAYTNTGFITAPPAEAGPFAGVGVQSFDGKGKKTATGMVSQNGNIIPVNITGTYTVSTGTLTLQISPVGITGHAFLVIEGDGVQLRAINTDPGSVITTDARKLAPNGD